MLHIKRLAMGMALAVLASLLSVSLNPAVSAFAANSAAPAAVVNTYPYGQCTYYAKSIRSDIGNHWGNARYWAAAARRNGFPVDGHPRVGDVVVFGAYVQGNSSYGHVGIVMQVKGTQFLVKSMWGNEANGRIHLNWHHTGAGVSFIHKKGSKPAATTPKPAAKATTPAKSAKATTPAKSTKTTTPAKSTKATTPAKSSKATTPAKSTKATTPAKSTQATTPAKSTKTPAAKPKTTPAAKPTAKPKSNK